MLVAGLAACFTSCKKDSDETVDPGSSHAQTVIFAGETHNIKNVIAFENVQYSGNPNYSAIALIDDELVNENGGTANAAIIIFEGDIQAGTYYPKFEKEYPEVYPKVFYTTVDIESITSFDPGYFVNQLIAGEAYGAYYGSFTLQINRGDYVITTNNINVTDYEGQHGYRFEIDYEGNPKHYVFATVDEGVLNNGETDAVILTAGRMAYQFPIIGKKNIAGFIAWGIYDTPEGLITRTDMIGFQYQGDAIPTGQYTNPTLIFLEGMDTSNPAIIQAGTMNVEVNEDVYTVDINDAQINGKTYNMHYVGTLPFFDFPF